MARFNSDNRSRGRRDFKDSRDSRETRQYDAVCDNCGKNCKVPFKPTSGKPIYCNDCFGKMSGREERPRGRRESGSSELKEISQKLDTIIELLSSKK